jgi:hypothetical protein
MCSRKYVGISVQYWRSARRSSVGINNWKIPRHLPKSTAPRKWQRAVYCPLLVSDRRRIVNAEETSSLKSQIATLKTGRGQRRKYLAYVFTEHRAIVAATILNSTRAVETHTSLVSSRNLLATKWP